MLPKSCHLRTLHETAQVREDPVLTAQTQAPPKNVSLAQGPAVTGGTPQTWSTSGGATFTASARTDVLAVTHSCSRVELGTEQMLKWFFGTQHREESSGSCSFVWGFYCLQH